MRSISSVAEILKNQNNQMQLGFINYWFCFAKGIIAALWFRVISRDLTHYGKMQIYECQF